MMKRLAIAFVVFVAAGAAWFSQDRSTPEETVYEEQTATDEKAVDLSIKGIELLQGELGEEQWKLQADQAFYSEDNGQITVEKPHITYYLKDDGGTIVVTADHGIVNQSNKHARLWGNVIVMQSGGSMYTDELVYSGATQTLVAEGAVRFDGSDFAGTAENVVWSLTDSIIRAERNVVVEMQRGHNVGTLLGGDTDEKTQ